MVILEYINNQYTLIYIMYKCNKEIVIDCIFAFIWFIFVIVITFIIFNYYTLFYNTVTQTINIEYIFIIFLVYFGLCIIFCCGLWIYNKYVRFHPIEHNDNINSNSVNV